MKDLKTRRALRLFMTFAAIGGLANSIAVRPAMADDTIRIGAAFELSGRFVSFGSACKRGLDLAAENFGPKVVGKKYEIVYRDVQSDARATVSAFTELADNDHIQFMIGPIASSIVAAAVPSWQVNKPIWMVPGSSSTNLADAVGDSPYFFHTYPYSYHYYTTLSGALKQNIGSGKKVAVLFADDSYGRSHMPSVEKYFKQAGFDLVAEEAIRTQSPDMTPVLTRIRRLKPDVLLGVVEPTDAVTLAKQVRTLHLDIPYLVTTSAAKYLEWQKAVGEAQQGWISPATFLPHSENWPADKTYPKLFPSTKDWEKQFQAKYNREATDNDILCYNTLGMLLVAIDQAKTDDRDKVAAKLAEVDVMTPMGRGRFVASEKTKHQAFSDMIVFQRQNNQSVIVYPAEAATGKLITAPK
jgi:branched-chain amino acid transport system substrate-binding protein